jgi:hypothetical protein
MVYLRHTSHRAVRNDCGLLIVLEFKLVDNSISLFDSAPPPSTVVQLCISPLI